MAGSLALLAGCTGHGDSQAPVAPPGRDTAGSTAALKAGAAALQDNGPLAGMDIYLVGFHPMKQAPSEQMEAHHYCRQVNEDFAQCVLFDGNDARANLTGIEYIISERLFHGLPPDERHYWHPHNGEILSGQLLAPGLPEAAEHALMRKKLNSYGKTWHTWASGASARPGDRLPLGPPALAWSFNREGRSSGSHGGGPRPADGAVHRPCAPRPQRHGSARPPAAGRGRAEGPLCRTDMADPGRQRGVRPGSGDRTRLIRFWPAYGSLNVR
jgi:hypothetical protein